MKQIQHKASHPIGPGSIGSGWPRPIVLFSILTFFIACTFLSLAQETDEEITTSRSRNLHQWGAVTLFHGLPSDRVRAIAQDADGIMWFGTDRGLAKYDGRRVQAIVAEGLPAGRVLSIKVDDAGVLWIGTEAGATRFANGKFDLIRETEGIAISGIVAVGSGRTVLAGQNGVLFDCTVSLGTLPEERIASETRTCSRTNSPNSPEITSLAIKEETILIGTRNRGLMKLEDGSVTQIQSSLGAISTMLSGPNGQFWIGVAGRSADGGLYSANDLLRPRKVGGSVGTVSALGAGYRGDIWVATDGRGAFRFRDSQRQDAFTFEGTAGGLRSNTIYTVFVDREDVVWFGTDRGVCRYDPHGPRNEDVSTDSQSNFVRTLFQTKDGRVLCGTNRGLFVYDKTSRAWRQVDEFAGRTIYAIVEDPAGRLLVGTSSGLYIDVNLDRGTVQERQPTDLAPGTPDSQTAETGITVSPTPAPQTTPTPEPRPIESVRAIRVFQNKTYMAIFGRGVQQLDGKRRKLIWPADQTNPTLREVTSLHPDGDKGLWIGTASSGAFVFDGERVTQEPAIDKLKGAAVWAIDGSDESGLWFATARGLYGFRGGELIEIAQGSDVRSVSVNNSNPSSPEIWCATAGGGLLRIAFDQQLGILTSTLDVEQGLISQNTYAILRLSPEGGEQTLLIGTTRGVVRYSPGERAPLLLATRVLSRRLHQLDELREGIRLDYPQNSLVLDVSAQSSRTFPEQFQYAFFIRDRDNQIINRKLSSDSQFVMENLSPGTYRVEVRAFNKDIIASEPLAFEFTVAGAPFPWTSTALAILLALALAALFWAIVEHGRIRRTSNALALANRELAGARLDLANEAERERRRIARDLHDQTLADLRHILMLTDQLRSSETGNGRETALEAPDFRAEIEAVSNEIRRICEDLSPSALENVGLTAALEWALTNALDRAAPDCKFEYEFVCDPGLEESLDVSHAVKIQIYRIAQEVINNICRHADAKHVRLSLQTADSALVLTIEDDGEKFDPELARERKGRGLTNIRARASILEADVQWTYTKDGRNRFMLRKPDTVKNAQQTT